MLLIVALHLGLTGLSASADTQQVTISGVPDVLDGDTLDIGPVRVRLHGIDAPETGQSCNAGGGATWRCGARAAMRLSELIGARPITCDALDRDPYGRIIGRCRADGLDLADRLVTEGLAWAFAEYSTDDIQAESDARDRGVGIWQAPTQTAWAYRDDRWARAVAGAPGGCPIKGNIGARSGERIYHTPWSPNYARTVIDETQGERWFCDEAAATAAGWRRAGE
ncbi:Succinoglycan biosynthesis protein ExoI [Jannaschia seosinensis]|uniref:Succinoglycan biosynthesis protein ExoI n=1 Tax=Jannaschia seosinensis TaxID=313367 RepID=A0A0M7B7L4_9RHOB|nr:thermonuclease family protein [Jannaschia seosinensis]CUH31289.1 Succinoglycan biosynthesis protein ExoI [Jannaschia seosinensis]